MKLTKILKLVLAILLLFGVVGGQVGVATAQVTAERLAKKEPKLPKFQTEVTDYFGDTRRIWDSDQDGWDDIWCSIYRKLNHRSIYADTDSDGVTDYDEMILWRNPFVVGPLPRKLTPEELEEQAKRNAQLHAERLQHERERWLVFKHERAKALNGTRVIDEAELEREKKDIHDEILRRAKEFGPVLVTPHNAIGALKAGISQVFPGGVEGSNFTGAGQSIGSIEPAVPHPHDAFLGRVEWQTHFGTQAEPNDHTTNIMGTMIGDGTGNAAAKGAAPGATVRVYPSVSAPFSYLTAALSHGVSNTSNGAFVGWSGWLEEEDGDMFPYWSSRMESSETEPNYCGLYTDMSRLIDTITVAHSQHIPVFSASNDRNQSDPPGWDGRFFYADKEGVPGGVKKYEVLLMPPPKPGEADGGFDSLPSGYSTSKNSLVVGGINMGDEPYEQSSWGPTDDGRIKPDVVAKATSMTTTSGLQGFVSGLAGTSYSAPIIAGGIAVMQEAIQSFGVGPYRGATKKALVIHEAQDLGNPGPDYTFGWGAPVFANSIYLIESNAEKEGSPFIKETFVKPGAPVEIKVRVGSLPDPNPDPNVPPSVLAPRPLKVTIVWTDPAKSVPPNVMDSFDDRTPILVNNLDLKVVPVVQEGEPEPFLPWVLDVENPGAPATKGVNSVDNVEQVVVDYAYGEYIIKVSANGVLQGGSQDVSIIITGIAAGGSTSAPENPYIVPSGGGINQVFLGWTAPVGVKYNLQSSSDLQTWVTEVENLTTNNEQIGYIAPMGSDTRKFWRLAW